MVFQSKFDLDPLTIYMAYLGSWEIETMFDLYKNIVDRDTVNVHGDYRLYATMLQSDILLTIGERTLIIDTKYYGQTLLSHYNKKILHSANVNQIYTYVTNKDVSLSGKVDGMLLYAKTQEEITPQGQIGLPKGNVTMFRTLDLNQPFSGIKDQLDRIVHETEMRHKVK